MQLVIFTGDKVVGARYAKTPAIRQTRPAIDYGDANSDIQAAQEAGIRPAGRTSGARCPRRQVSCDTVMLGNRCE